MLGVSPNKKNSKEDGCQLIRGLFLTLKCAPIPIPPQDPHETQRNNVPNVGRMLPQPRAPPKLKVSICSR